MGSRSALLIAAALLVGVIAAGSAQEGGEPRESDSRGDGPFIVVSITAFNEVTFDVKLKNPRTGYVHSVTVTVDIARLLHIGDRVRERRRRGEVILTPVGAPRQEREPAPGPFVYRPVGYETREPKLPDCLKEGVPCPAPPEGEPRTRLLRLDKLAGVVDAVHVASMRFDFTTSGFGLPRKTGCDVLATGTFTSGARRDPIGPLKIGTPIVRGNSDKAAIPFYDTTVAGVTTRFRGALVLREEEGLPRIERQTSVFRSGANPPFSDDYGVMGGGGLLVYRGRKVSDADLCCCQAFVGDYTVPKKAPRRLDPDKCGFSAGQFAFGIHIIVASKGRDVYVLALRGAGKVLRDTVYEAGFDDAILFDGGTGAFMMRNPSTVVFDGRRDQYPKDPRQSGVNSTRLCITEAP